jgi:hypothetical protein
MIEEAQQRITRGTKYKWPNAWPVSTDGFGLGVGNHWLRRNGTQIYHEDDWSYLTAAVPSGHETTLDLVVTAQGHPGRWCREPLLP